jgi:hypothetical protein
LSSIAAAIVLESKNCAACASLAPASAIVCMFCVCEYVHVYAHAHAHIHMHTKHIHTASARERNRRNQRERERAREIEGRRERTNTHTHTHTQNGRQTDISYLHQSNPRHRARHTQSEERQVPNQNFPIGSPGSKDANRWAKSSQKTPLRYAPLEAEELL